MHPIRRQCGAAALAATLVLFFIATLVAAFAHRNHVFELRTSANQYRATQAFEAAEAGLEWATAMLNDPRPLDQACVAGAGSDKSLGERHLAGAVAAACVRSGTGWRCSCPSHGDPALTPAEDDAPAPAFRVLIAPGPATGLSHVTSTGCSRLAGGCAPDEGAAAEATARLQVTLGFVPSPVVPPLAPLTVRGSVHAGPAAIGLHNSDADSGGVAVHAGGIVAAPNARATSAPGSPVEDSIAEHDAGLASLDGSRLFASYFGMAKALWREQPGVARIACEGDCAAAVTQATAPARGHRLVWIDGDLRLSGRVTLGTPERPIVIVAGGAVHLSGPVTIHGIAYGTSLSWNDGAGGMVHGAAISEGGYEGNAAPDFIYDAGLLASLRRNAGSYARLPGSWRDF